MLHDLFSMGPSVGEKILRAVLIYVFLLAALRVGGKRELGQLNTMDFVVLLAVANAVQNGIIGQDDSVTGAIIGATSLFFLNEAAAFASSKSARMHRLLVGTPTTLVEKGVLLENALRRERMSVSDLMEALLENGAEDIRDVERCVMEPSGKIVVTLRKPRA